jgi:diguanylate cyclase (GGDEF)-like protein
MQDKRDPDLMGALHLDMRTLVVLLLVSSVLMTVVLGLGARGRRAPGMGSWLAGLGCFAAGLLLIGSRTELAPIFSVAVADTLLFAGLSAQAVALARFRQRPAPLWLAACLPVVFIALAATRHQYAAYTLVAALGLGLPLLAMGLLALRLGLGPARWVVAFFSVASAALLVVRAVRIVWADAGIGELFETDALSSLTFTTLFGAIITGSFAFLEMQRQRAEDQIRQMAMTDALTGLLNRQAFEEAARRELARSRRDGLPVSFLMADLDHFKHVNDTFGHLAGDQVLIEVSRAMRASLREQDALARYGGEEFCAVLAATGGQQALQAAERLRAAVASLEIAALRGQSITVSVGVTVNGAADEAGVSGCVRRADEALYRAKNTGRNRVCLWEPAPAVPGVAGADPAAAAQPLQA